MGTFEKLQQKAYNVIGDIITHHPRLNLTSHFSSSSSITNLATFVSLELGLLFSQPTISDVIKYTLTRGYLSPVHMTIIRHPKMTKPGSLNGTLLIDEGTVPLHTHMYSSENYKTMYKRFLDKLFTSIFGKTHPFSSSDVIKIETWLSTKYIPSVSNLSEVDMIPSESIPKELGIDLIHILGHVIRHQEIAVYNKHGLRSIVERIEEGIFGTGKSNIEWQSFWAYHIILSYSWSAIDVSTMIFDFSNRLFKPTAIQTIDVLYSISLMPHSLDEYYYKQTKNQRHISFCRQLCNTYISVFIQFVLTNTWIHSDTKSRLIRKLKRINIVIGHYIENNNTDLQSISNQSDWIPALIHRNMKIYNQLINVVGTPYHPTMESYTVNAFFHTSTNTIYIPSALLTSPIVNLDEDPCYSIANLGFIIGHELCHCFDKEGLLYDYMNVYHPHSILSTSEMTMYTKKTNKICKYVIDQGYSNTYMSKSSFSDEMVSDITGFLLTEAVLIDYWSHKNMDITVGLDWFYKQYALLWSSTNRDVYDPNTSHIPNKYRVNCVLVSSKNFRTKHNLPVMYESVFIDG
jgi:hypothetical protein